MAALSAKGGAHTFSRQYAFSIPAFMIFAFALRACADPRSPCPAARPHCAGARTAAVGAFRATPTPALEKRRMPGKALIPSLLPSTGERGGRLNHPALESGNVKTSRAAGSADKARWYMSSDANQTAPREADAIAGASTILVAPEEPIGETIELSLLIAVSLNPFDRLSFMSSRAEITCAAGKSAAKGFASLPKCPKMAVCSATVTSFKSKGGKTPPFAPAVGFRVAPPGAMLACSSGFKDDNKLTWPKPPRNCASWHGLGHEQKQLALTPYTQLGQVTEEAENSFLKDNPHAGCGHREDLFPTSPVAYPVYAMKKVYIGGDSIMFNKNIQFFRLGCQDDISHYKSELTLTKGNRTIKRVGEVMNWSYRVGGNFFHSLIESFPLFLSIAPFMRQNKDLPLLGLKYQFGMYHKHLEPLVGVPLGKMRRYEMQQKDIVLAETAYQPVYQLCGKQSKGLWWELRRRHLLHPKGLPMFNPDWSQRAIRPLNEKQMSRVPRNWVLVLAVRPNGTERFITQTEDIVKGLVRIFGRRRVVLFRGDRSIMEAQALFRRARLFIAAHGAAMSNMIFMPTGSAVLEIRPDGYPNPCYHSLADACSVEYNLVLGKGKKSGNLEVNPKEVLGVARDIHQRWLKANK